MFATSVLVRPWSARCSPRSVGRRTSTCSPSWTTSMSRLTRSLSSPLGPFTRTLSGSIETVTPAGTGIGCRPILDIARRLPDLCQDLAADTRGAGVVAGHHATGSGDDRGPHAAEDLGYMAGVDVGPPAGPGDPP